MSIASGSGSSSMTSSSGFFSGVSSMTSSSGSWSMTSSSGSLSKTSSSGSSWMTSSSGSFFFYGAFFLGLTFSFFVVTTCAEGFLLNDQNSMRALRCLRILLKSICCGFWVFLIRIRSLFEAFSLLTIRFSPLRLQRARCGYCYNCVGEVHRLRKVFCSGIE